MAAQWLSATAQAISVLTHYKNAQIKVRGAEITLKDDNQGGSPGVACCRGTTVPGGGSGPQHLSWDESSTPLPSWRVGLSASVAGTNCVQTNRLCQRLAARSSWRLSLLLPPPSPGYARRRAHLLGGQHDRGETPKGLRGKCCQDVGHKNTPTNRRSGSSAPPRRVPI